MIMTLVISDFNKPNLHSVKRSIVGWQEPGVSASFWNEHGVFPISGDFGGLPKIAEYRIPLTIFGRLNINDFSSRPPPNPGFFGKIIGKIFPTKLYPVPIQIPVPVEVAINHIFPVPFSKSFLIPIVKHIGIPINKPVFENILHKHTHSPSWGNADC